MLEAAPFLVANSPRLLVSVECASRSCSPAPSLFGGSNARACVQLTIYFYKAQRNCAKNRYKLRHSILILVTRLHHCCRSSEIQTSRAFHSLFFRYSLLVSAVLASSGTQRSFFSANKDRNPRKALSPHCKGATPNQSRSQ